MEYQKIINLLGKTIGSTKSLKYTTRKWIEVNDHSNGAYDSGKDIRFKTPRLISDLCDFNDAYIVVTGNVTATDLNNDDYGRKLALKNNAPFFKKLIVS